MPDLNNATTTKRAKRGYRKVSMTLPVQEYTALAKLADQESRTPDQQAAYLLRQKLHELFDQAMDQAQLDERSGAWGEDENGVASDSEAVISGV